MKETLKHFHQLGRKYNTFHLLGNMMKINKKQYPQTTCFMHIQDNYVHCYIQYIQYNIPKQELFIDKHEGITSNKVYAQAKITSYEDSGLLKRSHSKIIQQQCNPQGSGKPKNNQQHIMQHHNVCNNNRLSSYHPLRSTPCNGLLYHQETLSSGDLHDESSDLEEEAAGEGPEQEEHDVRQASETYQQGHQQLSPKTFDTPWRRRSVTLIHKLKELSKVHPNRRKKTFIFHRIVLLSS